MHICAPHVCLGLLESDPLELELQRVVSHCVGAGNQTWVFCKVAANALFCETSPGPWPLESFCVLLVYFVHVEARGQMEEVAFLLPPHGFWGFNSARRVWCLDLLKHPGSLVSN